MALRHGALSFLDVGAGPALVFLHGIGSAALSFRRQIAAFQDRYRVLAWNAPGYGESAALPHEWPNAGAYSDVVREWLAAAGVRKYRLVGHSLGALIAARVAADDPDGLVCLTMASCAVGHARLEPSERERLLTSRIDDVAALGARGMAEKRGPRLLGPTAAPDAIREVVDIMAAIHPAGYAQAARMLSRGDMFADMARWRAGLPVQIIYGSLDVITPPTVNQRVAKARPSARVDIVEGAGHALYVEAAPAFNAALGAFLAACV